MNRKPLPLEARIWERILRKKTDVFLRDDFDDLGGYDQVGRGLRNLTQKGRLLKIGFGIYTRAEKSPFDGRPVPLKGLPSLAAEALDRLGVETGPSKFDRAYNTGTSTQVPTGRVIAVSRRVRRKIGFNGNYMSFEFAAS